MTALSLISLFLFSTGAAHAVPAETPASPTLYSSEGQTEGGSPGGVGTADGVRFFESVGTHSLPDSDEKVVISESGDKIQFRIRGAGPTEPLIEKGSAWFVAPVTKDEVWVHLGKGRLFYYSWKSESSSKVEEWTYPRLGSVPLPPQIEAKIKAQIGPVR